MTVLTVESLTKRFGSLTAVNDVTLSIPKGEHHAIIGPNGAGKTTLFDLITGALAPTDGSIRFAGTDVSETREDERARRGLVRSFQLTSLFEELSIHENLRLAVQATEQRFNPLRRPDSALATEATGWLEELDIAADPSTPATELSHGDRRRLEVGMALATDPTLLLLDEPTSGVSAEATDQLVSLISRLTADRTLMLIEHDVDLAFDFADRVTVMDEGRVIAQGTPDSVATNEAVQTAYLGGYDGTALD